MKKKKKNNKKQSGTNIARRSYKTKKVRKLRLGRVLIAFLLLILIIFLLKMFIKFPIKNIYIEGNNNLKDQEIIDLAKISNYPSIFKYTSYTIKKNIEKSPYVYKAKVEKLSLSEISIKVVENKILFYNKIEKKTILSNGVSINKELECPILINYVPDKVYKKLLEEFVHVDDDIIKRISEIKYEPSNVDDERFLFTMNDGNYVFITLEKLADINNYVKINIEIVNKYGNKNGVLNLDVGEYFEIFNE